MAAEVGRGRVHRLASSPESQRLDQQAATARVQADYNQAKLKAERNELLTKDGLFPKLI
jgi:hypothetical protein